MHKSKLQLATSSYFTLERNGLYQSVELLVLNFFFFETSCLCFVCSINYVYMQLFVRCILSNKINYKFHFH